MAQIRTKASESHVLINDDGAHQRRVFLALAKQQQENKLCDVVLQTEGRVFHAHRSILAASSDYFNALFTTEMVEMTCSSVSLELKPEVVQELLNYMYTGQIHLNETNVKDILVASDYLIISDLKEHAAMFLKAALSPGNCLEICEFADRCACVVLRDAASSCILQHFSKLAKSDEFTRLSFEVLEELTSNDDILVRGEEEIYEAIIAWVTHDREARKKQFELLFRNVRLFSMPRDYIRDNLERQPLIATSLPCMGHLVQGLKALVFPESDDDDDEEEETNHPRNCLRKDDVVLLAVGGLSAGRRQKAAWAYLAAGNKTWMRLQDMTSEREEHAVVVCERFLYVIGGSHPRKKSVERYDARTNTWSAVADLPEGASGLAAVAFAGKIYVLGGKDGFRAMSAVQCYEPNTNTWKLLQPLNHARKALCAAVVHGCIYAIGGCTFDNNSLNIVEKFTSGTGEWVEVKPMSQQRKYACAEVLDDKIVVIGGYQGTSSEALQSCEVYSPEVDEWYPLTDLSVPRAAAGVAQLGKNIFVVGGRHNRQDVKSVERYEPVSGTWSIDVEEMPLGCAWLQCGVVKLPRQTRAAKGEHAAKM